LADKSRVLLADMTMIPLCTELLDAAATADKLSFGGEWKVVQLAQRRIGSQQQQRSRQG
jgi:hypothetical protein